MPAITPIVFASFKNQSLSIAEIVDNQVILTDENNDFISGTNPLPVTTVPGAGGTPAEVTIAGATTDAAGRVRTSLPLTLGDYKAINDDLPLLYDTDGTGTPSYTQSDAFFTLDVAAGEYLVQQSKMFHNYASGKSQQVEFTVINFQNEANVVKRMGYFSTSTVAPYTASRDGMYLEADGTTYRLRIDRLGTVVLNQERSQWDDPLNGNGPSGKTIDFENFNVFVFDFLWLGGAIFRAWAYLDGELVLFHTFNFPSTNDFTFVQSPNQPIRYEIRSTTGTGTLKPVCAQVSSEGPEAPVGIVRSANNGQTQCDADVAGTEYAVLGIRLNSSFRTASINTLAVNIFNAASQDFLWQVKFNPTVAGPPVWNPVADSAIELSLGDTPNTVSGGTIIASGYGSGNSNLALQSALPSTLRLGCTIAGVFDTLWITVVPFSNSQDIFSSVTWQELV